ncbi:DUF5994 family protein [Actinokineospora sp. NBRC 105648]|uniref:DUF5994 family protein n=1 Tax=Actinokineospora sp. NBRC 105648 TaxID=3032206 RepID=UPI0024A02B8F|nr:DUF5994 family protein [Actinokineospora sp. NBRC 105648]GLZ36957.1 hypothetical protein Acsp05_05820 [Actinokineospora sp. NBRC 105648]
MSSNLLSPTNNTNNTGDDNDTSAARFTLKQGAPTRGHVDGAWWPRSSDPATELPALITEFAPITRISYNLDAWDQVERRITVAGKMVRLEGFHSAQPDIVVLISPNRTRIRLLVIPPNTDADAARATLSAASTSDDSATVEQILKDNGITGHSSANNSL